MTTAATLLAVAATAGSSAHGAEMAPDRAGDEGGVAATATATAAAKKPSKRPAGRNRCPAGTFPQTRARGGRVTYVRDRRGRLRCRKIAARRPAAPVTASNASGRLAQTASGVRDVLTVRPDALSRLERALGKRRTRRLLDVTLSGWQARAKAASAVPRAVTTLDFAPSKGVSGKATFEQKELAGNESGFDVAGSVEVTATRESAKDLVPPGLTEKLPTDVKSATAKLEASFKDSIRKCADKGKAPGKISARGKVTVTVERDGAPPVSVELEASFEASYTATVGEDGKWTGIDDVKVNSTFASGGSGKSTETYRGRRVGTGFTTASLLAPGAGAAAIEKDVAQISSTEGGTFGPKGSWRFDQGFPINDLRTEENVIAMAKASIASTIATLAVLEYVRKVARERSEKEECGGRYKVAMRVEGTGNFATHSARGTLNVDLVAKPVGEAVPATRWEGSGPAPWTGLVFTSKSECPYVSPVTGGTMTFMLELTPAGRLKVSFEPSQGGASSTASIDCPPEDENDPPPIPGQPGTSLIGTAPTTFELPADGGTQPFGGGFTDGGDGFFNVGTIKIERVK